MITGIRIPTLAVFILLGSCAINGCHGNRTNERIDAATPVLEDDPAEVTHTLDPYTLTVPGSTFELEMVFIPPADVEHADGTRETIGPLWISAVEIPWDLYDVFVFSMDDDGEVAAADAVTRPSKPYISMDRGFGHDGYPAISMSYRGAAAFCTWLTSVTGDHYRLPTETEWQYICSLSGITADNAEEYAWFDANADYTTHPVGSLQPGRNSLYDIWGNAAEWATSADGSPIVLGGSYQDPIENIGCDASREPSPAWNESDPQFPKSEWWLADAPFVGFRIVREPDPNQGD